MISGAAAQAFTKLKGYRELRPDAHFNQLSIIA
jgi:hypothetical protein